MAKGAYIGVNNIAYKMKKCYIGVDGVARKVKKAYIGVNGVARLIWSASNPKLSYYGIVRYELCMSRDGLAASHVGSYAIFAGGQQTDSWSSQDNVVDIEAIDTSLTYTHKSYGISQKRKYLIGTHTNDYALFAGGWSNPNYSDESNVVDAFDASLSNHIPSPLSIARYDGAASHVGDYALFAGGCSAGSYVNTIDIYNNSLTKQSNKSLSKGKCNLAGTHIGKYAIFAGGALSSGQCNIVDTYDTSLTHKKAENLSLAREHLSAAHVGSYAIFAGGYATQSGWGGTYTSAVTTVDVYDANLTKISTVSNLTQTHSVTDLPCASACGSFALVDVGSFYDSSTGTNRNIIDVYDTSLTKTIMYDRTLSYVNTHVGNYLFSYGITAFTVT